MIMWFAALAALFEGVAWGADSTPVAGSPSVERVQADLLTQQGQIEKLKKQVADLQALAKRSPQSGSEPLSAARIAGLEEVKRRLTYLENNPDTTTQKDIDVIRERLTSFESRITGLETKMTDAEARLDWNDQVDAEQAVAIAVLEDKVARLDMMDTAILEDVVELEVAQRIEFGPLERRPVSLEFIMASFQEVGAGKYYRYESADLLWLRYPDASTLFGGGMGINFDIKPFFALGFQGRGHISTAGGGTAEVLMLPAAYVDARRRVDIHAILGWAYRGFPEAVDSPDVARVGQTRAFGRHGLVIGTGFGLTLIGYGTKSGETPGELVFRPEIKVAVTGDDAYGTFGGTFIWRIGMVP